MSINPYAVMFCAAFLVLLGTLALIIFVLNSNSGVMGFEPKEEVAKKIYESLGSISTRDLRYDDFISKYPEGDNSLYADIKKLDVIDMPGLMSIL
jgi:hypothetical protein